MRVLALPARRNRGRNPYNAILADELERLGWSVEEASIGSAVSTRADIVHLHWPQAPASEGLILALRRAAGLLILLLIQKAKGARIVWTIHNVRSHEMRRPRFERTLMRAVVRLLDGFIVLNRHTPQEAVAAYPPLAGLPSAMVPHFIYGDSYPAAPPRADARKRLELPSDLPVVGFVGELKRYKGLDRALAAMLEAPPESIRGFVAGAFRDGGEAARVRQMVEEARASGRDIRLHEGFLDDARLISAIAACDLLLLPYGSASNSGFAILAAEQGVAMLLADTPIFRDLAEELGPPTAVADKGFTGEEVLSAAQAARKLGRLTPPDGFRAFRSQRRAAELTDGFFRTLVGARSVSKPGEPTRRKTRA